MVYHIGESIQNTCVTAKNNSNVGTFLQLFVKTQGHIYYVQTDSTIFHMESFCKYCYPILSSHAIAAIAQKKERKQDEGNTEF